jgi:hypothetical protein
MSDFTREQLAMFATLATDEADRRAALCYAADDPRREAAAQLLMARLYQDYTTPPVGRWCKHCGQPS